MTRQEARLLQGLGAIYTLNQAAKLMSGMSDVKARAWLEEEGLVRTIRGRKLVVWIDVVERVRGVDLAEPTRPPKQKMRLADV